MTGPVNYNWAKTDAYNQARASYRQNYQANSVEQAFINKNGNEFDLESNIKLGDESGRALTFYDLRNAFALDELNDQTRGEFFSKTPYISDIQGNPIIFSKLTTFIEEELKAANPHLTAQQLNGAQTLGVGTIIQIPPSIKSIDLTQIIPEKDLTKAPLSK